MASLNVVVLVGNLTRDPELRYTQNGVAKAQFTVALNRYWTDREGNRQEETTFVPVVVWGAQGENCANYLKKGRAVAVHGRLSIRKYTDDEGQVKRITEVIADTVQFLGGPQERTQAQDGGKSDSTGYGEEEEVPF